MSCYYRPSCGGVGRAGWSVLVAGGGVGDGGEGVDAGRWTVSGRSAGCAVWGWSAALGAVAGGQVTRCIRSGSWRVARKGWPVRFSMTRINSRASKHSWKCPRMRSSRRWCTGRSPRELFRSRQPASTAISCLYASARSCVVRVASEVRQPFAVQVRLAGGRRGVNAEQPAGGAAQPGLGLGPADQFAAAAGRPGVGALDELAQVGDQVGPHGRVPLGLFGVLHAGPRPRAPPSSSPPRNPPWTSPTRRVPATLWKRPDGPTRRWPRCCCGAASRRGVVPAAAAQVGPVRGQRRRSRGRPSTPSGAGSTRPDRP